LGSGGGARICSYAAYVRRRDSRWNTEVDSKSVGFAVPPTRSAGVSGCPDDITLGARPSHSPPPNVPRVHCTASLEWPHPATRPRSVTFAGKRLLERFGDDSCGVF